MKPAPSESWLTPADMTLLKEMNIEPEVSCPECWRLLKRLRESEAARERWRARWAWTFGALQAFVAFFVWRFVAASFGWL